MDDKVNKKFEIIRGVSEGIYTVKNAASLLGLTVQRIKQFCNGYQKDGERVSIMGHHTKRKSFRWRKRCRHFGELLQIGATVYDWFECGTPCVLYIIIDDATGALTDLYFCQFECNDGYLSILNQTFTKYGIPMGICSSMPGLFNQKEINKKNTDSNIQSKTFLGEFIENKLGIEIINIDANQGRRCHEVLCDILHDNLSAWLKSQGIANIEQANKQIFRYIDIFNSDYSISAKSNDSLFIPLNSDNFNLIYDYSFVKDENI